MKITVFTPAYNRAYIIETLYRSLQKQTFRDFEWLVVDDGSTDDTEELFQKILQDQNDFLIRYLKQENGGKHRAINRSVQMAQGELFFIVDSDDFLPSDSLEIITQVELSIPQTEKVHFAGVCGLKIYSRQQELGKTFSGEYLDITTLERKKCQITGDKAEVYYTNILMHYPFPEFDGEKFCTESIVWDRIAYAHLKLRFFNQNIYCCDYLEDGLTKQGWQLYANNPQQWGLSIYQDRLFGKNNFWEDSIQTYRFFLWEKNKMTMQRIAFLLHVSLPTLYMKILIQHGANLVRKILRKTLLKTFI